MHEDYDAPRGAPRVYLHVKHLLWQGEVTQDNAHANMPKICKALLLRNPTAKERKVERRLMLARGGQARKAKARKSDGRLPKR